MKIYIHKASFISPQVTFGEVDLENIKACRKNILTVIEPQYEGIPRSILRRMGKAVRIGVGATLPLLREIKDFSGVIIGTANGGMEDCVNFFNQIIEYDEGNLTPTNFVQSTTNAVASQIGFMAANKGYNSTHVHLGHAFENALYDAFMQTQHEPQSVYLVGGVEEISDYNYNIDHLAGWNKLEDVESTELFESATNGSIAGEGAAMFLMSGIAEGAGSVISGLHTFNTTDPEEIAQQQATFIREHFPEGEQPGIILSGENGDIRELPHYQMLENALQEVPVARYKHLTGEYPTAFSAALWFANHILQSQAVPSVMIKKGDSTAIQKVLLYNSYHMAQHSLMVVSRV